MTTVIIRNFFPVDRKVSANFVRGVFGSELLHIQDDDDDEVLQRIETVTALRLDVRRWATMEVQRKMVEAVHQCGRSHVTTWKQLVEFWRKNDISECAAIMWQVCYGSFDARPDWDQVLEREYMSMNNLTYRQPDVGGNWDTMPKGCIARQIAGQKNILVKALNNAAKKTHGMQLTISRSAEEITSKNRYRKRKKGACLTSFVKGGDGTVRKDYKVGQMVLDTTVRA